MHVNICWLEICAQNKFTLYKLHKLYGAPTARMNMIGLIGQRSFREKKDIQQTTLSHLGQNDHIKMMALFNLFFLDVENKKFAACERICLRCALRVYCDK